MPVHDEIEVMPVEHRREELPQIEHVGVVGVARGGEEGWQIMANIEGYAAYIERKFLRKIYTHAYELADVIAEADAFFRDQLANRTLPSGAKLDETAAEELERIFSTKAAQYDVGMAAHVARAEGEQPAPFDPDLRP